jgi:hypothetical protein
MKVLLWMALILPWFTLMFLNKNSIKRYMPVTVFTCLLVTIIYEIGYTYRLWTIQQPIVSWGHITDPSFAYGVLAVGTLWVFYLTSHKFWVYVVTNTVMDAFFSFVAVAYILPLLRIANYDRAQPWQLFIITFGLSFVAYGYYLWQQGLFKSPDDTDKSRRGYADKSEADRMFRTRTKVK